VEIEKIHYVFYDNGILRAMAKDETGKVHDLVYDSLIKYEPSLKEGLYKLVFTEASFLEFIGEGDFLTKYKPSLKLNLFEDIKNQANKSSLDKKLYKAYERAFSYFLGHTELSKEKLLEKIDRQLGFSNSPATKDLIGEAIGFYRKKLERDDQWVCESLAHYLAWNAVCNFLHFEQHNFKEDSSIDNEKFKQIIEWLLRIFHDRRSNGIDLDSHRLFTLAQQYLSILNEYKISKKAILRGKDLCDANVIHYATFGTIDSHACIVVTTDELEVLEERIKIQKEMMQFLFEAEDSKLNYTSGKIYKAIKTCEIIKCIDPVCL